MEISNFTTQSTTTFPAVVAPVEVLYGLIAVVCSAVGTCGNAFALVYFISKRKDIATIIYIFITIVDIIICLLVLPIGLSYFNERDRVLFGNRFVCNAWGHIWSIMTQFSVFFVALLSITRTVSIVCPFRIISKKLVINIIVLYFVIQLIVLLVMVYWANLQYSYFVGFVDCTNYYTDDDDDVIDKMRTVIEILSYVIPLLVITGSACISVKALAYRGPEGKSEALKRQASITIMFITIVYIIFNLPLCITIVINRISYYYDDYVFDFDAPAYYIMNLFFQLSVPLNSLINPVVYVMRMGDFRQRTIKISQRVLPRKNVAKPVNNVGRTPMSNMVMMTDLGQSTLDLVEKVTVDKLTLGRDYITNAAQNL